MTEATELQRLFLFQEKERVKRPILCFVGQRLRQLIVFAVLAMTVFVGVTEVKASVPSAFSSRENMRVPQTLQVMGQWGSFFPSGEGDVQHVFHDEEGDAQDYTEFLVAATPALLYQREADVQVGLARVQNHLNNQRWSDARNEAQALESRDKTGQSTLFLTQACIALEDWSCFGAGRERLVHEKHGQLLLGVASWLWSFGHPVRADAVLRQSLSVGNVSDESQRILAHLHKDSDLPTVVVGLGLGGDSNLPNNLEQTVLGGESGGCQSPDSPGAFVVVDSLRLAHRSKWSVFGQGLLNYQLAHQWSTNRDNQVYDRFSHGLRGEWSYSFVTAAFSLQQVVLAHKFSSPLSTVGEGSLSFKSLRSTMPFGFTYSYGQEQYGDLADIWEGSAPNGSDFSLFYEPLARRAYHRGTLAARRHLGPSHLAWFVWGQVDSEFEDDFEAQWIGSELILRQDFHSVTGELGVSANWRQASQGREFIEGQWGEMGGELSHALGSSLRVSGRGSAVFGSVSTGQVGDTRTPYRKVQLALEVFYVWP